MSIFLASAFREAPDISDVEVHGPYVLFVSRRVCPNASCSSSVENVGPVVGRTRALARAAKSGPWMERSRTSGSFAAKSSMAFSGRSGVSGRS